MLPEKKIKSSNVTLYMKKDTKDIERKLVRHYNAPNRSYLVAKLYFAEAERLGIKLRGKQ